jgi:hypothetical protein
VDPDPGVARIHHSYARLRAVGFADLCWLAPLAASLRALVGACRVSKTRIPVSVLVGFLAAPGIHSAARRCPP